MLGAVAILVKREDCAIATSSRDVADYEVCGLCAICKSVYTCTYKASKCKRTSIRPHCAISKSSLWYMGYVPRGGAFECPRIYCTSNSCIMVFIVYGICTARELYVLPPYR